MRRFYAVAAFLTLFVPTHALAEAFNNESVIALSSADVGDAVILAKIDSLPCAYDVSTEQIVKLKNANVSNAVITAMVNRCIGSSRAQGGGDNNSADPLVKRTPGLYIQVGTDENNNIRSIRPTNVGGAKIEGNGSILFPFTAKLAIAREAAQTSATSASPTFYFYFEAADIKTGDFGTSASVAAQSPSEFSLVRFKSSSGQREMTIGKASPFKTVAGIDPKNTIPFSMEEIGDGIFKVTMKSDLPKGQYAFILRSGSDAYRIYDFQVN